ncbi:hypothetical protein KY366_08650 [Candidatus Woesearchaeota archaeon]|nr:hypothetical protein [Candidatus Woesearchaeota archaeon]
MVFRRKIRFKEDDVVSFFKDITLSKLYDCFYYHFHNLPISMESDPETEETNKKLCSMNSVLGTYFIDLTINLRCKLRDDFEKLQKGDTLPNGTNIHEALYAVDSGPYNKAKEIIIEGSGDQAKLYINEFEVLERYRRSIDYMLVVPTKRLFHEHPNAFPEKVIKGLHRDSIDGVLSCSSNNFVRYLNILEANPDFNRIGEEYREDIQRAIRRIMEVRQFYIDKQHVNRFQEERNNFIKYLNRIFIRRPNSNK